MRPLPLPLDSKAQAMENKRDCFEFKNYKGNTYLVIAKGKGEGKSILCQNIDGEIDQMEMDITEDELNRLHTDLIQKIIPNHLPCEREFFVSGYSPYSWMIRMGPCEQPCKGCKYEHIRKHIKPVDS